MYSISIIIPVYNGGEKFRRCLASVKRISPPAAEVIIVADGESDGSWRYGAEYGYTIVRLAENRGPAAARNAGAAAASGDLFLFLDADVLVPSDIVARVSRLFAASPALTALIGSYDDTPGETNFLSQYRNLLHHYVHQAANEEGFTFWGACGAIRREAFLAVGGFDERYRQPSIEDIELGHRLVLQGKRIQLQKDLQIKHLKRWELRSMLTTDIFCRALPWSRLLLSSKSMPNDLNISYANRVKTVAALLVLFLLPATLVVSIPALVIALPLGLFLFANLRFYRFLGKRRGVMFALRAIPLHWLYYVYGGLVYGGTACQFWLRKALARVLPAERRV